MELMTRGVRPSSMMSPRQVRGTVLTVLLCSALAGCGSVTASSAAGSDSTPSPPVASSTAAASSSAPATTAAVATGCASVNQATSVTVHRTMHLVDPIRVGALSTTQHHAALVRALFGQFCDAIAHAAAARGIVHCPADFGVSYSGTFYDGSLPLARFVYGASGCQTVSLTADGTTKFTTVLAAAPKLRADMAAVLGEPASMLAPPQSQSGKAAPNKLR
jgi:hypothetical protein